MTRPCSPSLPLAPSINILSTIVQKYQTWVTPWGDVQRSPFEQLREKEERFQEHGSKSAVSVLEISDTNQPKVEAKDREEVTS